MLDRPCLFFSPLLEKEGRGGIQLFLIMSPPFVKGCASIPGGQGYGSNDSFKMFSTPL